MQPGLADPVLDSQRIFRGVLDAMSHPGRVVSLGLARPVVAPLHPATLAICLALVDFETPVWLDATSRAADVVAHLRFHCGCRIVDEPARARFAVVADAASMPALDRFDRGPTADRARYRVRRAAGRGRAARAVLGEPACQPRSLSTGC
jgi:alpha-D-ribose 1-methylphosphonate 5-triphosphate synthase subunit PhnH